jgi:hypothetical protein
MLMMREKVHSEVLGEIQQLLGAESQAPLSQCFQEIGLVQAVETTSLQGIASADSVEPQGRLAHIEAPPRRLSFVVFPDLQCIDGCWHVDIISLRSSSMVTSLSNKVLKNALSHCISMVNTCSLSFRVTSRLTRFLS